MPVTAPTDRRFLRAQVKPGRRNRPWRARLRTARRVLTVALVLALGAYGSLALARSRVFRVNRVVVSGNERLSNGEVVALLEGIAGKNIMSVDLDEWRRRVLACPWVEDATLRLSFPSTVEVAVRERYPIAIGRIGEELYLVDDRGGVIDEFGPRYADIDLPILDGLGPVPGRQPELDERRARLAAKLLADTRGKPALARRISQVDVSDPDDAVVILDGDTTRVKLGDEQFTQRLESYLQLASKLREQVPEIDYVDLRFGERLYVGSQPPAKGTRGPRAAGVSNQ